MNTTTSKEKRIRRHRRVRARIVGTPARPRFSVFRSNRYLQVQLIDDTRGVTLVAASDMKLAGSSTGSKGASAPQSRIGRAGALGKEIAKAAQKKGISTVVFDRGGYTYQGIIRAVAEGAREGGLTF